MNNTSVQLYYTLTLSDFIISDKDIINTQAPDVISFSRKKTHHTQNTLYQKIHEIHISAIFNLSKTVISAGSLA